MATFQNKFQSVRQDWTTPKSLFAKLDAEFHFTTDLAASPDNALCVRYYTSADDGLAQPWTGTCWCNPPYGDRQSKMVDWIKRAWELSQSDESLTVVMLVPARTNTRWFHRYCMTAAEVRFICGRPKFGDSAHGLPQPLVLVVFHKAASTKFSSFYL